LSVLRIEHGLFALEPTVGPLSLPEIWKSRFLLSLGKQFPDRVKK
jgi:hypothetical protein